VPWAEVFATISAAFLVVAWIIDKQSGTNFFNTLGPFGGLITGSSLTYVVQRRLQSGAERRSRNREYVQEYYGPLLTKIEEIRKGIREHASLGPEDLDEVRSYTVKPQYYTMGGKLRDDFSSFLTGLERVQRQAPFYRSRITDLIVQKGNVHLNASRPGALLVPDVVPSPVLLRYADGHEAHSFSLVDCVLLGKKPLDMIRDEVPGFREESLSLAYSINTPARETTRGRVVLPVEQRYGECNGAADRIVDEVRMEVTTISGYSSFIEDCASLAKLGDSLSQRLTKYVGQYVQSVDI
jgi:hypothetical protein